MSFLLLKSTRRGQQGLQSQPSVGTTSGRNNNVSVASSSSRSNDSFFSSHSQPPTSQYNRFSNNRGSAGSSMNQVMVGDQVQVQRTQHHFQKRRSCAQKQPQQNQVLHGSNQQHEVCMDEVMEDLRILERQQRDSQRLLQSVKLTKQHKLSQKEQLEQTLASLKYKNGQSKAQLSLARQVLSSSTRSLASTKLRSDKSSDNLKSFDEKLKRSIDTIRSLHEKRRRLDDMLLRLVEKDGLIRKELEEQRNILNAKSSELEDFKHKEELLVKAIQIAKLKVQEIIEDTGKIRSTLGGLEVELTETQQMEVSTRMRVESVQKDIEKENTRHELAKKHHEGRMKDLSTLKETLLSQIAEIKERNSDKEQEHLSLFEKCVDIQKHLGHEVSDSAMNARLNVAKYRMVVEETKSKVLEDTKRASNLEQRIEALEASVASQGQLNRDIQNQNQVLAIENEEHRQVQEKRLTERQEFIMKVDDAKQKLQELLDIEASVEKENKSMREELDAKKAEFGGILNASRERLVELTFETEGLDQTYTRLLKEMQSEKVRCEEMVNSAKSKSEIAKREMEKVQKQADDLSNLPPLDDDASIEAMKKEEDENISKMLAKQAEMIKEYPCLSKIEISFDTSKSKKSRIDSALSELRAKCEARIEACRAERHRRITAKQEEAKAQTRTEKRIRKESEKNLKSRSRSIHRSESISSHGASSSRSMNRMLASKASASKSGTRIESEKKRSRDKARRNDISSKDRNERESLLKKEGNTDSSSKNETGSEKEEMVYFEHIDSKSRSNTSNASGISNQRQKLKSRSASKSKSYGNQNMVKNDRRKKVPSKFDNDPEVEYHSVKCTKLNLDEEDSSLVSEKKIRGVLRTTANDDEWTHDGTISTSRSKVRFEDENHIALTKDESTSKALKRPSTITISSSSMKRMKHDKFITDFEDEEFVITKERGSIERDKSLKRKEKTASTKTSSKRNDQSEHTSTATSKRPSNTPSNRESSTSSDKREKQSSREKKVHSSVSKKRRESSSTKDRSTSSIVREKLNALKQKSSALSQSSSRSRRKKSKVSGTGLSFNDDEGYSFLNA